ncbi:hypothetical protein COOONC_10007 [Cooperia oncophora]
MNVLMDLLRQKSKNSFAEQPRTAKEPSLQRVPQVPQEEAQPPVAREPERQPEPQQAEAPAQFQPQQQDGPWPTWAVRPPELLVQGTQEEGPLPTADLAPEMNKEQEPRPPSAECGPEAQQQAGMMPQGEPQQQVAPPDYQQPAPQDEAQRKKKC